MLLIGTLLPYCVYPAGYDGATAAGARVPPRFADALFLKLDLRFFDLRRTGDRLWRYFALDADADAEAAAVVARLHLCKFTMHRSIPAKALDKRSMVDSSEYELGCPPPPLNRLWSTRLSEKLAASCELSTFILGWVGLFCFVLFCIFAIFYFFWLVVCFFYRLLACLRFLFYFICVIVCVILVCFMLC